MKSRVLITLLSSATVVQSASLDFFRDVYPFLKTNCIACHNKTTDKAGLNMETPELMIKGGDSGPSIVPGKSAESLIVLAALHKEDMEMPPSNNKSGAINLTPKEISLLKRWVDEGAKSSVQNERAVVLKSFTATTDPIYSIAVTKDGRYAACGRSNKIVIYDLATRALVGEISDPDEKNGAAHRAVVQSLAFSPDDKMLASGSFREVKLWKLDIAASLKAQSRHAASTPLSNEIIKKIAAVGKSAIVTSALSADGKLAATGAADGTVKLWDAVATKLVMELQGSVTTAKKMASLEQIIAAQALEQAFLKAEVTRYMTQDKALDVLLAKAQEAIVTMSKVLPEKQKAVPATTEAKNEAQKLVDELGAKFTASKDAALEKQLKTAQDKLISAKTAEVSALAAVSATESNIKDAKDDVERINRSKTANGKAVAEGNATSDVAKKAQAKAIADLALLKKSASKFNSKLVAVELSKDGARVGLMLEDGSVHVWATRTGIPIEEIDKLDLRVPEQLEAKDGPAAQATSFVNLRAAPQWRLERKLSSRGLFADRVNALSFSPDGKILATGGGELSRSGEIILFDVTTGSVTQKWTDAHTDAVLCLDFSPDGKYLASGAADKLARVTHVSSGKSEQLFEGHTHYVTGIDYRSDGRVLATAGADGSVVTWNILMNERRKKIEGWSKEVTALQFIGATNQIVTSAGDNRIRIVTDEGAEIRSIPNLPDYMQSVAAPQHGGVIIGGDEAGQLHLWDPAGKELTVFRANQPSH